GLHGWGSGLSHDGKTFLLSAEGGLVRVYGLDPPQELRQFPIGLNLVRLRCDPTGRRFAGFSENDRTLHVFDVRTGEALARLTHSSALGSFAWSSDGAVIATGCDNGAVFLWNVQTGEQKAKLEGHEDHVDVVGFNRGGSLLLTHAWDHY